MQQVEHLLSPSATNWSTKESTFFPFLPSFMAWPDDRGRLCECVCACVRERERERERETDRERERERERERDSNSPLPAILYTLTFLVIIPM